MGGLTGHGSLITGGNGGIGFGLATGLLAAGADVAIAARNAQMTKGADIDLLESARQNRKFVEVRVQRIPVRRGADPEEFGSVAVLLVDPAMTFPHRRHRGDGRG